MERRRLVKEGRDNCTDIKERKKREDKRKVLL